MNQTKYIYFETPLAQPPNHLHLERTVKIWCEHRQIVLKQFQFHVWSCKSATYWVSWKIFAEIRIRISSKRMNGEIKKDLNICTPILGSNKT